MQTLDDLAARRADANQRYADAVKHAAATGELPDDATLDEFRVVLSRDMDDFLSDVRPLRARYEAVERIQASDASAAEANEILSDRQTVVLTAARLAKEENERHRQRLVEIARPLEEFDREHFGVHAKRDSANRVRREALSLLRDTADPAIDRRIVELDARRRSLESENVSLQQVIRGRAPVRGIVPRTARTIKELKTRIHTLEYKNRPELGDGPAPGDRASREDQIARLRSEIRRREDAKAKVEQNNQEMHELQAEQQRIEQSKLDPANGVSVV